MQSGHVLCRTDPIAPLQAFLMSKSRCCMTVAAGKNIDLYWSESLIIPKWWFKLASSMHAPVCKTGPVHTKVWNLTSVSTRSSSACNRSTSQQLFFTCWEDKKRLFFNTLLCVAFPFPPAHRLQPGFLSPDWQRVTLPWQRTFRGMLADLKGRDAHCSGRNLFLHRNQPNTDTVEQNISVQLSRKTRRRNKDEHEPLERVRFSTVSTAIRVRKRAPVPAAGERNNSGNALWIYLNYFQLSWSGKDKHFYSRQGSEKNSSNPKRSF